MANKNNKASLSESGGFIQFKPAGLALFSIVLIIVTGLLTALLLENFARPAQAKQSTSADMAAPHADAK